MWKRFRVAVCWTACLAKAAAAAMAVGPAGVAQDAEAPALSIASDPRPRTAAAWPRHVIDNASRGADGIRLGDMNADGYPDIITGWEQGGQVRVAVNPGPGGARTPWPTLDAGRAPDVEDAAWVDLDGDGCLDAISCSEGATRRMSVHWGIPGAAGPQDAPGRPGARTHGSSANRFRWRPDEPAGTIPATAWRTEVLPPAAGVMMWMFCAPMDVDGRWGIDLVAGGKGKGAALGWWAAPPNPRALDRWTWHPWRPAGWIMTVRPIDMDGDGDLDVLFSDRKGERRGCYWLENPAPADPLEPVWREHPIGGADREVMFIDVADLDGDGKEDVLAAAKPRLIMFLRRLTADGRQWLEHPIEVPADAGTAKAVAAGDLDQDGRLDLVFTTEGSTGGRHGVMALEPRPSALDGGWDARTISGVDGIKHDLVRLLDLDGDGDLDVLTCEETRNLGVIWYENPAVRRPGWPDGRD
ncbi:MAG TPA: VCBS repeat-containing protein [Candidatus Paceibacterota bacterium]|nr:VCBS repeat-containing protein [Verrucomicrobiota bacterium]HRZ93057.1 VCBS repeat-containing protein [Candidatus Paceibacterota bacterium]